MNSKECLEKLKEMPTCSECELYGKCFERPLCNELYNTIKQDLDRVEMFEKALDKACELLADYTGICPFSKKLMYETNCDLNCKDTYKECWKKYFMKEVLGNKWYNKPLPAFAPKENYDYSFVNDCLQKAEKYDCERLEKLEKEIKDGTLSDGYHTFNDLYCQRMYLFATIVNQNKELAWKSLKHEDGKLCFDGDWFIVGIDTPKGSYTYHYENKYWNLFDCLELEVAKHWDGHTDKDVSRLLSLPSENTKLKKAIEILVDVFDIKLATSIFADELGDYYLEFRIDINKRILRKITQEEYELLKEVLENVKRN